jgi:hypothetical protein
MPFHQHINLTEIEIRLLVYKKGIIKEPKTMMREQTIIIIETRKRDLVSRKH